MITDTLVGKIRRELRLNILSELNMLRPIFYAQVINLLLGAGAVFADGTGTTEPLPAGKTTAVGPASMQPPAETAAHENKRWNPSARSPETNAESIPADVSSAVENKASGAFRSCDPLPAPVIFAVGDCEAAIVPLTLVSISNIRTGDLYLQIESLGTFDPEVIAYIDDSSRPLTAVNGVGCNLAGKSGCSYLFSIKDAVPPGLHSVVIRVRRHGLACTLSEPSAPIKIQYEPGGYVGLMPLATRTEAGQVTANIVSEHRQAFASLPDPWELTNDPNGDEAKLAQARMQASAADSGSEFEYRFLSPARFPRYSFGQHGEPLDRLGLVIYEGMMFTAAADGSFTVEFLAETQEIQTELRLQLEFKKAGQWHTITIPPITLPAHDPMNNRSRVHHVVQHGYSSALELRGLPIVESELRRNGTAVFGFGASQYRPGAAF